MSDETERFSSASDRVIERGGTYTHTEHGRVECRGIWRETQWVDTLHEVDERDTIVIRFSPDGGDWSDELAESLDEFLEAID